jgi:hypothetical protein
MVSNLSEKVVVVDTRIVLVDILYRPPLLSRKKGNIVELPGLEINPQSL